MDCPFCGNKMDEGEVRFPPKSNSITGFKGEIGWFEDRSWIKDIKLGNCSGGYVPFFKAMKCDECHKLIMDIELPEDLQIDKMTCPNCGARIDSDYPKCPECKYDFYDDSEDE